jgi:hypothetical protein
VLHTTEIGKCCLGLHLCEALPFLLLPIGLFLGQLGVDVRLNAEDEAGEGGGREDGLMT